MKVHGKKYLTSFFLYSPRARRPPGIRLIVTGVSRDTSWQVRSLLGSMASPERIHDPGSRMTCRLDTFSYGLLTIWNSWTWSSIGLHSGSHIVNGPHLIN